MYYVDHYYEEEEKDECNEQEYREEGKDIISNNKMKEQVSYVGFH